MWYNVHKLNDRRLLLMPNFSPELPAYINLVLDRLEAFGHEAFVVGGCVRDLMRGASPDDYDVTTSALPDETAEVFSDITVLKTGISHGTVTLLVPDGDKRRPVEVTTYRIDGIYADSRHPTSVTFTRSIEYDLARRDFTVNAMAYSPSRGLLDIFEGKNDLEKRIICCVRSPIRLSEDALRILRALRFSSVLGFEIERYTAEAAIEMREMLDNISLERSYVELCKLICGGNVGYVLREFRPVFEQVIPCVKLLNNSQYSAISEAVSSCLPDRVTRFAALFALCEVGDIRSALRRLKADNATSHAVISLCDAFSGEIPTNVGGAKRLCAKLGREDSLRLYDILAAYHRDESEIFGGYIMRFIENDECVSLDQLAVGGGDMLSLGISGKAVGRTLKALLDAVIDERLRNDREELLSAARKILDGAE